MSLKKILKGFRNLSKEEFRILAVCEQLMIKHQYAPMERIPSTAMLSSSFTRKRIREFNKKKYLRRWLWFGP